MPKQCDYEKDEIRCKANVFSHGKCKIHQRFRTDDRYAKEKAKSAPTKRKRIPLMSKVRQDKLTQLHAQDKAFYEKLADERPHVCAVCPKYLGEEMNIINFHHILPKSKYENLRYEPENIMFLCYTCHQEAHANNIPGWYVEKKIEKINYFRQKGLL